MLHVAVINIVLFISIYFVISSFSLHRAQINNKQIELETEMSNLAELAGKFEVTMPEYKQLRLCRKELVMVKMLWDYAYIIESSIDDWKLTSWMEIDIDQMDTDCKKFSKDIRALDKEMRAWDTYTGMENTLKNMMTSLRAVAELQNPAIRDRHWTQLMKQTGVSGRFKFVLLSLSVT